MHMHSATKLLIKTYVAIIYNRGKLINLKTESLDD